MHKHFEAFSFDEDAFLFNTSTPMAYNIGEDESTVQIIETSIFTRQVQALLTDEEYRRLQRTLILHPDSGVVIPGSGGLRKVRW